MSKNRGYKTLSFKFKRQPYRVSCLTIETAIDMVILMQDILSLDQFYPPKF